MEQVFSNLQFERPVSLRNDGTDRLFVVEQFGKIMTFPNKADVTETTVFLDLQDRVIANEIYIEAGLLGLAFHPNYADNGYFYVNYITEEPLRTILSRFERLTTDATRADPNSEVILLEIEQPTHNHNGGDLAFASDGYLYVALGDGSLGNDTFDHAQNLETLLGAVLRIDVDHPGDGLNYGIPPDNPFVGNQQGYREEIYAYGFRNPWRFSFDAETGELWLGDVGETSWEEIDLLTPGGNYGWPITEGLVCHQAPTCDQTGLIPPIWTYDHQIGRAITGGYVYRGDAASELYGRYIYADWGERKVWMLQLDQQNNPVNIQLDTPIKFFSGFGEDHHHELYAVAYFTGEIFRFHRTSTDPESPPVPGTITRFDIAGPNPFQHTTVFEFELEEAGPARLVVYDALGRENTVLFDGVVAAGAPQRVTFEAGGLPGGIYFCRLEAAGATETRKIVLVR